MGERKFVCHMTKMATMPIYGKSPSEIFSRTVRPMTLKLGMLHLVLGLIIVCSNFDPVFQPNLGHQNCETSNYCQTNTNGKEGFFYIL